MGTRASKSIFAGAIVAVVVGAVISGIVSLDSPAQERALRLDGRRVADLRRMADAVDLYWTRHARLPASPEELVRESGVVVDLGDPETGQPYEYRAVSDSGYELCAGFARTSAMASEENPGFWSHSAGRQCFALTARKLENRRAVSLAVPDH